MEKSEGERAGLRAMPVKARRLIGCCLLLLLALMLVSIATTSTPVSGRSPAHIIYWTEKHVQISWATFHTVYYNTKV